MTWKELGVGLQAVRDGHDLPYRTAEGLIGLGYLLPGHQGNDFRPTLTERGRQWLTRWEGVETGSGLLPARRAHATAGTTHGHDPRD